MLMGEAKAKRFKDCAEQGVTLYVDSHSTYKGLFIRVDSTSNNCIIEVDDVPELVDKILEVYDRMIDLKYPNGR